MKRVLVAGLLALWGLSLAHATASADCFHVYKPCIRLPVPAIPIYCPKFKFFCESCNWKNCPCPSGPWYAQFPGGGAPGYAPPGYSGYGGSVYGGGWGYSGYAAATWSGYGYGQPTQDWNAGYPPQAQAWNNAYPQPTQQWSGNYAPHYTAYPYHGNNP